MACRHSGHALLGGHEGTLNTEPCESRFCQTEGPEYLWKYLLFLIVIGVLREIGDSQRTVGQNCHPAPIPKLLNFLL